MRAGIARGAPAISAALAAGAIAVTVSMVRGNGITTPSNTGTDWKSRYANALALPF